MRTLTLIATALLAACGGGGSSESDTLVETAPEPASTAAVPMPPPVSLPVPASGGTGVAAATPAAPTEPNTGYTGTQTDPPPTAPGETPRCKTTYRCPFGWIDPATDPASALPAPSY